MDVYINFPFSDTILHFQCGLQALLRKLQEGSVGTGNNGVVAGVLATVGELARVVCDHNFIKLLAGHLSWFISRYLLITCCRQLIKGVRNLKF